VLHPVRESTRSNPEPVFRGILSHLEPGLLHRKRLFFNSQDLMFHLSLALRRFPFEAVCWVAGLLSLALLNPTTPHFSICPLKHLGLDFCPGCGLGTAISFLFHGDLTASFQAHPLGIFAAIVLSFRTIDLTRQYFKSYGKSH
jgi:hypothetical protein